MGRGSDDERRRKKEKKSKKRKRKESETAEERRARRIAKKREKQDLFGGYTNQDNPFGDSNLHAQFTWHKRDALKGKGTAEQKRRHRKEKLEEIAKVKKRRDEREQEELEMERLRDEEARLRESLHYQDWEQKEEEFHLRQQRRRSKIRITEGREKPVDVIAKNILLYQELVEGKEIGKDGKAVVAFGAGVQVELGEPHEIFEGLPLQELIDLRRDIDDYARLEGKNGKNSEFWSCLLILADNHIALEQAHGIVEGGSSRSRAGLHAEVEADLEKMFSGRNAGELERMQQEVKLKLDAAGTDPSVDAEYWEEVARQLRVTTAKSKLSEFHQEMLLAHLKALEELKQGRGGGESHAPTAAAVADDDDRTATREGEGSFSPELEEDDGYFSPDLEEDDESEGNDTTLGGEGHAASSSDVVDEAADREALRLQREAIMARQRGAVAASGVMDADAAAASGDSSLAMLRDAQRRGLDEGEELMAGGSDEVDLPEQIYSWHDKYRPRKPRYFNRVKTGYDWNKYNQTHYDHDNPPPKTVQGYKFNIFYPDLIDKTSTPSYVLEPADSSEFCILRFHAGPPYEDVAFKIVNKEWERGRKRGFKSVFERGILHLYFNFKRWRYRR